MSYKKLFLFVFFFLLSTLFITSKANAAVPVTGYAWSSNIGWILFDTDRPNPVEISTTTLTPTVGKFSGYAWSSNIGWISFNPADVAGCTPTPTRGCQASIDLTTGEVTGWARVVAGIGRTDGWDGWIELSGVNHTSPLANNAGGVTISTVNGAFSGYAWGGNVVGWVRFLASCPGCVGTITAEINAASTTITSGTATTIDWTSTNADNCSVTKDGAPWMTGISNAGVSSGNLTSATPFVLRCTNTPAGLDPVTDDVIVNVNNEDGDDGTTGGANGKMWVDNSPSFATTTKVRVGGKAKLNWLLPTGYAGCVGKNVTGMSKSLPSWENMSITSEKPNGSPYLTSIIPDIGEYKVYVYCGSEASSTNSVRIIVTDPTIIEI